MPRYAVTLTRVITETATFIVEADSAGEAQVAAEDTPWDQCVVTSSHDNVAADDDWRHGDVVEIMDLRPRSVRHRLAAALGYGAQQRPQRHQ